MFPEIINTGPEKANGAERKIYDMKKHSTQIGRTSIQRYMEPKPGSEIKMARSAAPPAHERKPPNPNQRGRGSHPKNEAHVDLTPAAHHRPLYINRIPTMATQTASQNAAYEREEYFAVCCSL